MGLKSIFRIKKTSNNQKSVLFDYISKDKKFLSVYKNYKINDKITDVNSLLPNGKMVVVSAYWCPDCRNNVPKMTKISESLQGWTFEIMDRDDTGVKEKYSIRKIPTFIVFKDSGEELGRIIENPESDSLDIDLLNIVKRNS